MNVLLTSAGRRNYLIKYFKDYRDTVKVFVADSDPSAPTMCEADKGFLVPRLDHEGYMNEANRICIKNSIDLIVPLHDHDVAKIGVVRDVHEDSGSSALTPNSGMARTCLDKLCTHDLLVESEIETATTATASADNAELMLNPLK